MQEFLLIVPEIFLTLTLASVIVCEITYYGERLRLVLSISLIGLLAALIQTIISYEYGAVQLFSGVLSIDGFALFFKLIFILLAILALIAVSDSNEVPADRRTEYCALILASTLAMCLVAAATDLILAFLSLLFLNVMSCFSRCLRQKIHSFDRSSSEVLRILVSVVVSPPLFVSNSFCVYSFP